MAIFPEIPTPSNAYHLHDANYQRFSTTIASAVRELKEAGITERELAAGLMRLGIEVTWRHPEWAMAWRQHIAAMRAIAFDHENDGRAVSAVNVDALVEALPITMEVD